MADNNETPKQNPTTGPFAVIETGGKQYVVREHEVATIEKIGGAEEGSEVVFDRVLMLWDGTRAKIGTPYLEGATVAAKVEKTGRAKKIHILKFKSKSRYTLRRGHRQSFVKVRVGKTG